MDTVKSDTMDKIAGLFGPATGESQGEEAPGGTEPPEGEEQQPGGEAQAGAEAGQETQEGAAAQPKEREVEVEVDGERYLVPERLSHRLIQHADYTRKTQDIAELRRVTTAEREAYTVDKQFEQEVAPERKELAILDGQLEQAKTINWTGMEAAQLMQVRAQLDALKDRRAEVEESIRRKRQGFEQKLGQLRTESLTAGSRFIENHIKAFDEGKKKALYAYGIREGYTQHEMENLIDPRLVVTLWKASQWDDLQASKPGINKRASSAAPVVKPGAANRNQQASADVQYRKALQGAKGSAAKAEIVQKRLESKLFGPAR